MGSLLSDQTFPLHHTIIQQVLKISHRFLRKLIGSLRFEMLFTPRGPYFLNEGLPKLEVLSKLLSILFCQSCRFQVVLYVTIYDPLIVSFERLAQLGLGPRR